jgi:hypothetical protein
MSDETVKHSVDGTKLLIDWKDSQKAIDLAEEQLRAMKKTHSVIEEKFCEWMLPEGMLSSLTEELTIGVWVGDELVLARVNKYGHATLQNWTIQRPQQEAA